MTRRGGRFSFGTTVQRKSKIYWMLEYTWDFYLYSISIKNEKVW